MVARPIQALAPNIPPCLHAESRQKSYRAPLGRTQKALRANKDDRDKQDQRHGLPVARRDVGRRQIVDHSDPEYTTQGKMTSLFGLESDRFGQVRRQA